MLRFALVGLMAFVGVLGGCAATGPLPLQRQVSEILVGHTTSTEVLDQLSHEGMLHTANSVSALSERGWATELVVISFDEKNSSVSRSLYLQRRSRKGFPQTKEMLYLRVQTELSDAVLDEPYENEMRKKVAILSAIHSLVVEDTRSYSEDQQTVSLMGMAQNALGVGIEKLKSQPRKAGQLESSSGFSYKHPTLGSASVTLSQDTERIYTIILEAWDNVDSVGNW